MLSVHELTRHWTQSDKQNLFDDLRGLLLASPLSFEYISERAHVHPTTLQNWCSGDVKSPHLLKVLAVYDVLGYDLVPIKRRRKVLN